MMKNLLILAAVLVVLSANSTSTAQSASDSLNIQLFRVIGTGDAAQVRLLLERGADVNSKDENGDTPLIDAAD